MRRRLKDNWQWHHWFAWRPVHIGAEMVWWEPVERTLRMRGYDPVWEYRFIDCEDHSAECLAHYAAKDEDNHRRLLRTWLKAADSGYWRDSAGLSIAAHPVADDTRNALQQDEPCR